VGRKVEDILKSFRSLERKLDVVFVHIDSFYIIARCNPGILSLSTLLSSSGFRVKVITPMDLFCISLDELKAFFTHTNPAIVGFYTNSDNVHSVRELACRVKKWLPGAQIIAGGPQASAEEEKLLDWPCLDALICGEGETAMLAYTEAVSSGKSLETVPSLIYRDGREIRKNTRAPLIEDLDTIPAIDHSILGPQLQVLNVTTGRGCPFGCAFCFQAIHGRRYRYRTALKVVEEITQNLERFNLKTFSITDDTFVAHPERAMKICNLLIEYKERSGRDFRFYCEGRVDIFARHPELLPLLKKAGLIRLQIGIESGTQDIINVYQKGITLSQVEKFVAQVRDIGDISLVGHFIIGGAFETRETVERSIDFARSLISSAPGVFESGAGYFCPYPGTEITRNPSRFGIKICEHQFRDGISTLEATCETESLSIVEIRKLKQHFYRQIDRVMKSNVSHIPYETMKNQFRWALKYSLTTFWHPYLKDRQAIDKYFYFLESPRFMRLNERDGKALLEIVPLRTLGMLVYNDDGVRLRLQGGLRNYTLSDPEKIFIYKRSCGKQKIRDIAEDVRVRFHPESELETVVHSVLVPFYKKLEHDFYMIFYE